jgi:hypothetical protein
MPPKAGPTMFRVIQAWTTAVEGSVSVAAVAHNVNGASVEALITLQVVRNGGFVLTAGPGAMDVPTGPTETPPSPVTTEAGCVLGSQYVSDVTVLWTAVGAVSLAGLAPTRRFACTQSVRHSSI